MLPKILEHCTKGKHGDEAPVPSCGDGGVIVDDPLSVAEPATSRSSSISMWELVENPSKDIGDVNMPGACLQIGSCVI